mmetsp:Transcript_31892/g.69799  ORF Transcript_31892/g.69799 Transcript_31892/m.69799 type:complete len:255 (+) Transcript_31892:1002-1766(+)
MDLVLAIVTLLILVLLLLPQVGNHVLDHLLERLELVRVYTGVRARHQQRQYTPVWLGQPGNQLPDCDASSIVHLCRDLHERRRRRQSLLEQMQGVIIIEHLHGVSDGLQLHHVIMLAGLILRSSLLTSTLCFNQQILVRLKRSLCGSDVSFSVRLLLPLACQLGLLLIQLSLCVTNFLALRTHEIVVRLRRGILVLGHRCQIALHVVTHLVQNTKHLCRSTNRRGLRSLVQLSHVVFHVRRNHRGNSCAQTLQK